MTLIVLVAFCLLTHDVSAQSVNPAQELSRELTALDREIAQARSFATGQSEGPLKEALLARVVLLQVTRDMLQQRALATRYNVALTYAVSGHASTPREPAAVLTNEIRALEARAQALAKEATTDPLKQIELATIGTTLAGLQQRALFDRYGIPLLAAVQGPTRVVQEPAPAPAPPDRAMERPVLPADVATVPQLEVMDVDARTITSTGVFVRYGWRLRVKNLGDQPARFDATIEFQDASGFVVDSHVQYGLALNAYDDHEFTGEALVRRESAEKVTKYNGKIKPR